MSDGIDYWRNEGEKVTDTSELGLDGEEVTDTSELDLPLVSLKDIGKDCSFNENDIVNWVISKDSKLPFGQKVVKLQPVSNKRYRVLYWDSEKYKFALVKEEYLSNFPVKSTINLKNNIVNEIKHLLFRNKYDSEKTGFSAFTDLYNVIKNAIDKIESMSDDKLYAKMQEFENTLFDSNKNNVEKVDYFYDIMNAYNLQNECSNILIIPLAYDYFFSLTSELEVFFEKSILSYINYYRGNSGQIETDKPDEPITEDIRDCLQNLFALLEELKLIDLPEYTWLKRIFHDNDFNYKFLVFLSDNTWNFGKYTRYAEEVAALSTLSWLSFLPLYDVILHESNNCSEQLYSRLFPQGDCHNSTKQCKGIWENITKVSKISDLSLTTYETDWLFQNSRNLELINIASFLKYINII